MAKTAPRIASVALGLGITALLLGWIPLLGWAAIIGAIITGAVALAETKDGPGRGQAITGLLLGIISGTLVLAATLALGLAFIVGSSQYIEAGTIEYSQTNGATSVTISGINQNKTLSEDQPVHLVVEGVNNSVYVSDGTRLLSLTLSGLGNSVSLPANTSITTINEGVNNRVDNR